ncbi:hypothetical protein BpHYR1_000254 [Brachionus plicatilis]|uniref:Uncharacterized protein n=1 Tax=Brachionus plicatilis TaxID=10195 RepID=A0A3M7R6W7_BRAPC|nr:hypothetical protein BpHYR1_000254 [Brachionus plicatilis]
MINNTNLLWNSKQSVVLQTSALGKTEVTSLCYIYMMVDEKS